MNDAPTPTKLSPPKDLRGDDLTPTKLSPPKDLRDDDLTPTKLSPPKDLRDDDLTPAKLSPPKDLRDDDLTPTKLSPPKDLRDDGCSAFYRGTKLFRKGKQQPDQRDTAVVKNVDNEDDGDVGEAPRGCWGAADGRRFFRLLSAAVRLQETLRTRSDFLPGLCSLCTVLPLFILFLSFANRII